MINFNPEDPDGSYICALRIIYFILSISGLIFACILLFILTKKLKKNINSDTILSMIAVLVDFLASSGLLFRAVFTKYPYNILQYHFNWCAYDMILNTHMLVFSGYVLGVLSFQRMLLIVFNRKISIWFWLILVFILNSVCWSQIILQIVNNNIAISKVEVFCNSKNNSTALMYKWVSLICMALTYSMTIISYVFIIVFSCKQCLKQLDLNLEKSVVYKQCRTIIFKSLCYLIPYMLIYSGRLFCWAYEYATGNPRTWMMEYVSIMLVSTSAVVNCLTVLYMNKEINKEFLELIYKFKLTYH
jgi:hypothetical protein